VPFNIASYASSLNDDCPGLRYGAGRIHSQFLEDVHLYNNHFEQAQLPDDRTPFALTEDEDQSGIKDIFNFSFAGF
jgi:thymidylate synthase